MTITRQSLSFSWVLIFVSAAFCLASPPAGIFDDIKMYVSFDESIHADYAMGSKQGRGTYHAVAGPSGQAFIDRDGKGLWYYAAGNLSRQGGTVSFWVRPNRSLESLSGAAQIFSTKPQASLLFTLDAAKQVVFFATAYTPAGQDWTWDWRCHVPAAAIAADDWTHVAVSWDVRGRIAGGPEEQLYGGTVLGEKRIYLNGELAAKSELVDVNDWEGGGEFFLGKGIVDAAYDELLIFEKPISARHVKWLYDNPVEASQSVRAMPEQNKDKQWFVYPGLVYKEYSDSLVAPSEPFHLTVPLKNITSVPQQGRLILTLLDWKSRPVGENVITDFSLEPDQQRNVDAVFTPEKFGCYKIRATIETQGHSEFRDITSLGCVPSDNPPRHPFFGAHVSMTKGMPEMARRLGVAYHRSHNMTQFTWWNAMQEEPGRWGLHQNWAYDLMRSKGFDIMGQWFSAPYWAVTLNDGTHPKKIPPSHYPANWMPTDLQAYADYVRKTLEVFPEIIEWEVWNEPYSSFFFGGSVEDYITLCKVAYETAKEIRPDLPVYAMINSGAWGRAVVEKGVLNYCDGLSFHMYGRWDGAWDNGLRTPREIRKMVEDVTGIQNVRLTNSETGIAGTTFLEGLDFPALPPMRMRSENNAELIAQRLVQSYVTQMSIGVERFYYYFHQPVNRSLCAESFYYTCEITRTPRPLFVAMGMLAWELDGGGFVGDVHRDGEFHAYIFQRNDGKSVAAVWSARGGELDLTFDGGTADYMGNALPTQNPVRITDEPMYLRSERAATELLTQLQDAPLTIVREPDALVTQAVGKGPASMEDFTLAQELGMSRMIPLNIAHAANMGLADEFAGDGKGGWADEGPFNDMRDLEPDLYRWLGVPVVVIDPDTNDGKSVITLKGKTLPSGPVQSEPIPVNVDGRKTRGLFFAHTANFAQVPGQMIGHYQITYADGEVVEVPIICGETIWDWWFDVQDTELSRTVPIQMTSAYDNDHTYRFIRLWYWDNPRQDVPLTSIAARSANTHAALIVVGITAAVW